MSFLVAYEWQAICDEEGKDRVRLEASAKDNGEAAPIHSTVRA